MRSERRRFALSALALAASPRLGFAQAPALSPNDAIGFLSQWEEFGWHWTGSEAETNSAQWLARQLSTPGTSTEVQSYPVALYEITRASLRSGERRVVALPLFDGASSSETGVSGRLCIAGADGDIAVLETAPDNPADPVLARARHDARYRAVIVITAGARSGLAPLDVGVPESGANRIPVIEVSSAERDWLLQAARDGRQGTVVAQFTRSDGTARNVVVAIPGTDPKRSPIVIWTGRSGWGPCVGERGGALFCATQAVRTVLQTRPVRGVVLAATSGEELGQLGLKNFVKRYPDLEAHAFGWIRLGANIGTRASAVNVDGTTKDWMDRARREMRIDAVRFSGDLDGGSALAAEGNGLVLTAAHGPLYHLPADQLPAAVELPQLTAMARALSRTLMVLANS
jgi:hypothetical protein